ncbi:MAG: hypothetical protein AB7V48_14795 [Sedimentibacter sp.]
MVRELISGVNFSVDNYVEILDFKDIKLDIDNDTCFIASILGCIEGIIQINKDKNYLTFLNMYKIKLRSKYKFYSLYYFIKDHEEYFKYIINYFNTWHGQKNEVFSYDEFNKKDLINNFYELAALLFEEKKMAEKDNDTNAMDEYINFCRNLSLLLDNCSSF